MREEFYLEKLSDEDREFYKKTVDLLDKGQKKKAEAKLNEFLAEKKNFVPALNKMAVINIHKKKYSKAEKLLKEALKNDSDYAPSLTNLGSIAKAKGKIKRAKTLYKKAIETDKEYGPAYNNLGVIYKEEGNISKSVKYLKKARKKGSFNYEFNTQKAFYKKPGCLFLIFLAGLIIFVLYLILI